MVGCCIKVRRSCARLPIFLVLSISNGLAIQDQGCALGMPPGDFVLRITRCVHDDEETIVFHSCVFHEKIIYHMHSINLDLR